MTRAGVHASTPPRSTINQKSIPRSWLSGATTRISVTMADHPEASTTPVRSSRDEPSGDRPALTTAPYYALGPVRSYVVFTDGGLRITERLEVVRSDGRIISGLYAAGATGQGGLLLEGHGHHLGWAFISGRIAGRNAAFDVPPVAKDAP